VADTDPRVLPLRDFYVENYKHANKGNAPALSKKQWPRAMGSFKELLEAVGSDERARLCIKRTFSDDYQRLKRCNPWDIVQDANKLLADDGKPNGKAAHKNGDPQGGASELPRIAANRAKLIALTGGKTS